VSDHGPPVLIWPALEQIPFKERKAPGARLPKSSPLLPRGDFKMNRRDWELLEKQLGDFSSRSPENGLMQNGIIILMMIAVFLVGLGAGGILSKTMQANTTHYAALISYPGQE
jgi:hypothetical protein